ncbi:hypothetical protein TARUN_10470 [Trichoderma arundinaceum]|uniref:Uncharacterized protein n=1 Tax=Trichoderma arundinaceum TaxID=490622 RepID=A0A395N7Z1_TRIAR|nr:hypothetical protein TARUN_10470 [Trichoderma arundinaceum]
MYGGTLPPEFYLSSAPFPLHSLRGRARLRYICNGLSLPLDTSVFYIQDFLSRNPSIIRYLAFNLVPHPDLIFSEPSQDYEVNVEDPNGRKQNRRMLRAIRQLEWVDQSVSHVAEKSRAGSLEDWDALAAMTKVRQSAILPSVYKKMLEQNLWSTDKKWRKKWQRRAVAKMRQDRPTSLLSIIVMPEDVVEEETF